MPNYFNGGETGKPELPIIIESLCLPEQAKVEISIIDSSIKTLQNYFIYPLQKVSPENIKKEFRIDKEFYKSDIFYPEKSAVVDNKGGVWRDLNVRTLRIYPFKYNPATKELKVYNRLVLKVKYSDEKGSIIKKNISTEWDHIYRDKVLNYSLLNDNSIMTSMANSNSYKYLIITADDFVSNIKPFADYKTRQGLLSKVYAVSQITTGKDNAVIRDFIKREFANNPGIEYVLLVGDESLIPMAIFHENEYNFDHVGDYAYACTNLQGNSLSIDRSAFYASFGIGRISAISGAEVDNFVSKSIGYETNPPLDNNWTSNALFVAQYNKNLDFFEDEKKKIAGWYLGFFSNIYGAYGGDGATNNTIKNAIESLGVGVINYRGHGAKDRWDSWNGVESFTSDNAFNLNNGRKLPVVFSISCDNSMLGYSGNCLAEGFTKSRSGAVAVLGASRVTANAPNDYLDEKIFSSLVSNNGINRISMISNNATKEVLDHFCGNNTGEIQTFGGNDDSRDAKKNALYYLWLGDPALDMYTRGISQIPGVEVNDYGSSVTVTAGIPCDICISGGINGTEVYSFVAADPANSVTTNSVSTTIRPLYITISAHNYVPYNAITGGTLLSDETWMYNMHVLGDVTSPVGKTLTVKPGTTLIFNNNSSLVVNGSLNANGATFDFVSKNSAIYNGIKVYGTATINSSTIKNADKGVYVLTPARLTLSNSILTNCNYGVYSDRAFAGVYSSNFTGCGTGVYCTNTNSTSTNPAIEHNTFYNSSFGIYLSASSPRINTNIFSKDAYGIYCLNNSSPSFGNADESGDCSFSDNTYGMVIRNGSNPVLGTVGCVNSGGYNRFFRNSSYHIWADNTCVVEARSNYWNELKITGAYVYYDPYYLVDAFGSPMGSMAQSPMSQSPEEKLYNVELGNASSTSVNLDMAKENINSQGTTEPQYNEKWSLKTKTSFLRNLVLLKKYDNAIKIGKELIKGYPDSILSVYALDLLWQSGRTNADRNKDFDSFLKELTSKGEKKYLHGKAELILALCDTLNGTEALDKVLKKYKGDKLLTGEILMDKFSCLLSRSEDRDKAASVLSEIDALFPNSEASGMAHLLFEGKSENLNGTLLNKTTAESEKASTEDNLSETVKEYALLGNYPNPFNPETVIRYALPEESNVELRIYNLMGKLVRTFTYNSQSSGYRNITWNGKDESGSMVSSGIYIYRLQAISNKNQGHVFIKSAKMMMLK